MSLLFDQNLSRRLPRLLAAEFPGSEQVLAVGLASVDDLTVWEYAAAKGLAIVTKDADFELLAEKLGPPPKVLWLHLGNGPTQAVESLLRSRATEIEFFLSTPTTRFLNCLRLTKKCPPIPSAALFFSPHTKSNFRLRVFAKRQSRQMPLTMKRWLVTRNWCSRATASRSAISSSLWNSISLLHSVQCR